VISNGEFEAKIDSGAERFVCQRTLVQNSTVNIMYWKVFAARIISEHSLFFFAFALGVWAWISPVSVARVLSRTQTRLPRLFCRQLVGRELCVKSGRRSCCDEVTGERENGKNSAPSAYLRRRPSRGHFSQNSSLDYLLKM
jgi:hypothetical protein